jgi:hypothetical protein
LCAEKALELKHSKEKLPVKETINNPSPKPNNIKPKQQKNNVKNLGLKLYGFSELQLTFGIFLIFKNII